MNDNIENQHADSLNMSLELFRKIFESAPDAMIVVNGEGKIVLLNPQTEKLFGYKADELLGQEVEILTPERFRRKHIDKRTSYSGHPIVRPMGTGLDLYGRRKDGSEVPVDISLSPLKTDDGLMIVSAIRDNSERKRIAELVRSNTELEQFAYVAAHDIKEPLRVIANYMEVLACEYKEKLDNTAQDYFSYTLGEARRMQAMVTDLLAYARLDSDGGQFCQVDLNEVLESVTTTLSKSITEAGADISHDQLPIVSGNHNQLMELYANLISNALKFRGEQPPCIHVSAHQDGPEWLLSVKDNGIGIDPKYRERIFAMFQRFHGKKEYAGTGIGLAVCRKIVERHGGQIWVESQPGQGATFFFTIPGSLEQK